MVPMQIQYKVLDVECEGQAKQLLHRYWKGHLDAQLSDEAFEGVFGQSPVPGKVIPLSALTAVENVVLLGQPPRLQ